MNKEANRNTPLAVVVAIMVVVLSSFLVYGFSDIHQEVAPTAASQGDKEVSGEEAAPASDEEATSEDASSEEASAEDKEAVGGEEVEESAPGYGDEKSTPADNSSAGAAETSDDEESSSGGEAPSEGGGSSPGYGE